VRRGADGLAELGQGPSASMGSVYLLVVDALLEIK